MSEEQFRCLDNLYFLMDMNRKSNAYELSRIKCENMKTAILATWGEDVVPGDASNTQVVLHTSHLKQHIGTGCKNKCTFRIWLKYNILLPRDVQTVFDETGLPESKVQIV